MPPTNPTLDTLERENARLRSANADNLEEIERLKTGLERADRALNDARAFSSDRVNTIGQMCDLLWGSLYGDEKKEEWGYPLQAARHAADVIREKAALEARAIAAETELDRYAKEDQQVHENYMGQLEGYLGRRPESLPDGIDELAKDRDALAALVEQLRDIQPDHGQYCGPDCSGCQITAALSTTPSSALAGLERRVQVVLLRELRQWISPLHSFTDIAGELQNRIEANSDH